MTTYKVKPTLVESGDQSNFGTTVVDPRKRPGAKPANDNRRPIKATLRRLGTRGIQILPPLIAAALVIFVMMN